MAAIVTATIDAALRSSRETAAQHHGDSSTAPYAVAQVIHRVSANRGKVMILRHKDLKCDEFNLA
jgi:hypothetical protein